MIADDIIQNLASRFSLPPAVVKSLEGQELPVGLLASYGLDAATAKKDPVASLTVLSHALEQVFSQHHDLSSSLSHILFGDPKAHESPTSPAGGRVMSILAGAAVQSSVGMHGYQPASKDKFAAVGKDFGKTLQQMAEAGGPVSKQTVDAWHQMVGAIAPSIAEKPHAAATSLQHPDAPKPKGPDPKAVNDFAGEMKGLGIDVQHFIEHFPFVSAARYKMLQSKTGLQDYAPMAQMTHAQMLDHVRTQPHPVYRNITAGQFSDMHDLATLHSMPTTGRTPPASLVAKLVTSGAKWNDVRDYFQQGGKQ